MNTLKRILALLLVAMTIFSLASCMGEITGGTGSGGGIVGPQDTGTDTEGTDDDVEMNDDPTDDFTVTLLADGQPYSPRMEMHVLWNNGSSIHRAKVDETGVARIDGLDGDYRVSLSVVPNEYTYNPNDTITTNDDRNIILNLYTLNRLGGSGTGLYDCYTFKKTGVYSAVIEDADDAIYFQYAPDGMGTYTIESWVDTVQDNINPYVDVYYGSSAWKAYERTIDDGGPIGSYTINFVHEVSIAKENISGGGQATYTFVVKAESKNNKYPITVTFAVKRDGDFELPSSVGPGGNTSGTAKGMVVPEFDFTNYDINDHEYDSKEYKIVYPEYEMVVDGKKVYVFDDAGYKLNPDDGFYHVYDREKYADTNGYGPILYAYITENARGFLDRAFTRVEYKNATEPASGDETVNSMLSVRGQNYKHFIEGYTKLSTYGEINGASYYCTGNCTCHDVNVKEGWACTTECEKCTPDCRRIPAELIGHEGYQAYANSDGLVAVTEELVEFLKGYADKTLFFYDGIGSAEKNPIDGKYYQAKGSSGWLFACAYYEEK